MYRTLLNVMLYDIQRYNFFFYTDEIKKRWQVIEKDVLSIVLEKIHDS